MPPLFALAEISDLGRRAINNPAVAGTQWSNMLWGTDELRVVHAVLNPTLMLSALAGYETTTAWLFSPDTADVLEIDLTTRAATVVTADSVDVAVVAVSSAHHTAAVALAQRSGLSSTAVAVPELITVVQDVSYLVMPLGVVRTVAALVDALATAQAPPAQTLSQRIALEAIGNGPTRTGLVSLLDPDLWDFPDAVLPEGSGPIAETMRDIGRPIATVVLRDANALLAFLLEDSLGRINGNLPSVHRRLRNELVPPTQVPVNPPLTAADVQARETGWQREARALYDLIFPNVAGRPPFRVHDHRALSYTELVLDAVNFGLFDTVAFEFPTETLSYGGFDLRYTRPAVAPAVAPPPDNDPDPAVLNRPQTYVYGGVSFTETFAVAGDVPRHVQELRDDLAVLGYGPLADADVAGAAAARRTFGPWLAAALREFQAYATMAQVARKPLATEPQPGGPNNASLGSTLVPVANDRPYSGPISGLLNAETREQVKMWVERDWHCPVVVEARTLTKARLATLRASRPGADRRGVVVQGAVAAANQNVWLARQVPDVSLSFVVWDHTGVASADPYAVGQPMVMCRFLPNPGWGGAVGTGTNALGMAAFLHPKGELSPPNVFGVPPARDVAPALWSTFRVVRAVSEVECMGYLDGINGWDTALTSAGPLHLTLGLMKDGAGNSPARFSDQAVLYPGELGGFLEYFAALEPAEFDTLFGRYGLGPLTGWRGAAPPHFLPAHRKYSGFVSMQADDGGRVDLRRVQIPGQNPLISPQDSQVAETFKTWHWTHRILYASRTSRVMTTRMWEFTRARVRELLSTTWRVNGATTQMTARDALGNVVVRPATVGDIFTSERTVAALVRQHVFSPPHLFGVSDRDAQYRNATDNDINFRNVSALFAQAQAVNGQPDPGLWGDAEQAALAAHMDGGALLPQPLQADGLPDVATWPNWLPGTGTWEYDNSWVMTASPSPVIDPLPNITVVRGSQTVLPVRARTATAFPLSVTLLVEAAPAGVVVIPPPVQGADFGLDVAADADLGRWTATVTASDGRFVTTLSFDIDVSDTPDPPSAHVYAPTPPAPPGLDTRHRSFLLDGDPLDPFPAP